jgi:PAS domain S-box-containing protein
MRSRPVVFLAALTVVYFLAGRLGLSLAFVHTSASAIWPPTGLAIAGCLLLGSWIWPAILAGAFLVNFTTSEAVVPSILIACGNTAEAIIASSVGRRRADPAETFAGTAGIMTYVAAAAVATAVAATVGTGALLLGGLAERPAAFMIWLTWWMGDLSSAILLTPAIVAFARSRDHRWSLRSGAEASVLFAAVLTAAYWVFGPTLAGVRSYPLMFVLLPLLLWAALRFGPVGAAGAMLATAAVASSGTISGFGPFARGTPNESLLLLQAYLGVKMVVMLTLAAEVAARRRVERDIRTLNLDLERRIEARSEELRRLHGHLVEAQHVAHIGSWEWDVRADSIWWSDELHRLYGLPVGTPITFERFISMVHPEDRARVQDTVAESARTAEPFVFEHRAVKPDGTVITLHSRGRVVTDAHGRVVRMLGIGHDVTERKRAEEERLELVREQAARREAEESNRMKDYFLATLSHELRTPINALLGWAQVLRQPGGDQEMRRKAIEAIQRNVWIQAQLVSDILDVARLRSGGISIDARPVALRAVVDGALDIMRPVIADKRIDVVVDIPDDAVVSGDARRLQQVCWNLLSNAAKFLDAGGRIAITARLDGDAIELEIEDNGPGIPAEFLPHAFEQFRQADPTVTRRHGGLGLGLAISRDLVQLHGGTIAAANRPEGGAVFTVRLPAAAGAAKEGASL